MDSANDQESRADAAYRHLLAYIEREDLGEGARLPSESEFVDRLGLSRTSIREALARLRAEGRAVSRRGSGSFVSAGVSAEMVRLSAIDSVQDLIDWHEFRVALESEVAALSAERRREEDLAEMRRAQDALLGKLATGQAEAEDAAFHRAIAIGARNPKLLDAVGALAAHIFRWSKFTGERGILTLTERREIIAVEHGEIIAAIAEQRPDLARAAVRRHLLNGRARVLSSLKL
ncbi:FadR/GntR family transcriptional regulator [Bosea sp. (in: a-proteobacteria)]|jgi:GntR family transcriptional repressor for pyruvate dehydrogenase complex|uniref:FadR/GntR family transcriptional regulator n=1 Tax=Bosea sp. (in: a-proteobacteria) TaxID=1871050 RepID=UPI003F72ECD1